MESCGRTESTPADAAGEKVILIGNPNVGKSVIFNYLTGKYVTVSNYPGTTVEVSAGTLSAHGKKLQVLDTPGVNSLIPMSEDEKVTRNILLQESRSHLIQVMDTKNVRRGLLISLQLAEMGLPFPVLLNMWDEAKSRGIEIETQTLSEILGAPILKTVAKEGQLNPHQILVSLVTITLFIPCIAQFFMMIKERGLRKALWISTAVIPIAFGVGGMLNFLLKWIGI